MKQILLTILFAFISLLNSNAQTYFDWNRSFGLNLGYSRVYSSHKFEYNDEPKDLFQLDCNIYGVYLGLGIAGHHDHYDNYYYYDGYDSYYNSLNTTILKIGPSFSINNYTNNRIILTPYLGVLMHSAGDFVENYYAYYEPWYGYYDDLYRTGYEHVYEKRFIYGLKASYCYKAFEVGLSVSNYDASITIGLNLSRQ